MQFHEHNELAEAVAAVREAEADYTAAEERRKKAREALVALLAVRGEREASVPAGNGQAWKVTVIAAERTKIDEAGLRKALGARAYNRLTKPAGVDKDKLEAALRDGLVDLDKVKPYLSIVTNAAFPKVTLVAEESP